MTAITGAYHPGRSWLHALDPRVKLWLALLGVLLCVMSGRLVLLSGVLIVAQAVLLVGGLPVRSVAGLWKALAPVILIILILQPLLAPGPGPALWQAGPVRLTAAGLAMGARYALRLAAAAFAVAIPVMTTPIPTLVRGLEKAGMPRALGMTVGLALHYLGTIADLYTVIAEAQQARGWDAGRGGLMRRAQAAIPTLIALIIASLRLSDSLALGLAARGFGARGPRTAWRDIHMRPADWVVFGVAGGCFAVVAALLIAAGN